MATTKKAQIESLKIKTSRLILREVKNDDLADVHELHSFPEVDEFNTLGIPENEAVTAEILSAWLQHGNGSNRTKYIFVIETLDKIFVGLIALTAIDLKFKSAKIWYKLLPTQWRQGFATEALRGLIAFAFEDLLLHRLEAGCAVNNVVSCKVLEKTGMIKEGGKRKVLPIRNEWIDNYEFAILEDDPR